MMSRPVLLLCQLMVAVVGLAIAGGGYLAWNLSKKYVKRQWKKVVA